MLLQGTAGASWGGSFCATDATSFAAEAARLYNTEDLWNACQQQGYTLLQRLYDADANLAVVKVRLLCGEPYEIFCRVSCCCRVTRLVLCSACREPFLLSRSGENGGEPRTSWGRCCGVSS